MLPSTTPSPATPRPHPLGHRRHQHHQRAGFTVAELLVGLILLTIGLIGTAGTATVLTYHTAANTRAARATTAALAKLATLRAAHCNSGSGSETDGPLDLSWTTHVAGPYARAHVAVSYRELRAHRTISYSASFLC